MDKIIRETVRAKRAYMDYLSMGPNRSLEKLAIIYRERWQDVGKSSVPTRRVTQLEEWSRKHGWQARLRAIADTESREAEEREAAYRREIMETGYAMIHNRVATLKETAERLYVETMDPDKRWLKDPKMVGREIAEVRRFNVSLFEQLRGVLSDIAKETGGRRDVTVLIGDAESPLQIKHSDHVDLGRLTEDELIQLEILVTRGTSRTGSLSTP